MANTMGNVVEGTMDDTVMETVPEVTKKFGFKKATPAAAIVGLGVLAGKKIIKKIKASKHDKAVQEQRSNVQMMIEELKSKGYAVYKDDVTVPDDDELFKPLTDDDLE